MFLAHLGHRLGSTDELLRGYPWYSVHLLSNIFGSQGELIGYPWSVVRPSICPPFSKILFSETAWPIKPVNLSVAYQIHTMEREHYIMNLIIILKATTRTEQLTKCYELLQKLRVRLELCKTGLSPPVILYN